MLNNNHTVLNITLFIAGLLFTVGIAVGLWLLAANHFGEWGFWGGFVLSLGVFSVMTARTSRRVLQELSAYLNEN